MALPGCRELAKPEKNATAAAAALSDMGRFCSKGLCELDWATEKDKHSKKERTKNERGPERERETQIHFLFAIAGWGIRLTGCCQSDALSVLCVGFQHRA